MSFIDERVVEMRFDNKQFEAGAKQSLNTLDELQEALKLDGSTRGLETLQRSINSFSVLSMTDSINTIADRFSNMGIIATTALVNITNRAIAAGEALLKSLTVDNIASGWEKFSKDTQSIGTLVAQGYDLGYVEDQLKRLMNFSDETSYHYTDMVDTLGKFTAAGRDLEDSITAMQGIALWTASTGQNAKVADRAMVQLAQAMGAGFMRRQDWMSIQTLNMDTDQYRQVALDTAVALGKVKKTGEDTYKSLKATTKAGAQEFTKAQFAESLTQGKWFDSDVMLETWKKYGSAVEVVDEYMEKHKDTIHTVSDAITTLTEQQNNSISKYAKEQGISVDEATKSLLNFDEVVKKYAKDNKVSLEEAGKALEEYKLLIDPMALAWYKAGQEARTFEDMIISIKDTVSTNLMEIFKDIVGNYEEATELFSAMTDQLWEMIVDPLDQFQKLMDKWHDFGGRVHLLNAFSHIWENILNVVNAVGSAFKDIFPGETTWQGLVKGTFEFSKFTHSLMFGEDTINKIKKIFEGFFSIFDLGGQAISAVVRTISGFSPELQSLANSFLDGAVSIATFIKDMATAAKESDFFYNSIQKVIDFVSPAFEFLGNVITKAIDGFEKFTGIDLHIPTFKEFSDTLNNIGNVFKPFTNLVGKAANAIRDFFVGLNNPKNDDTERKIGIFERLGQIFSKIGKILEPIAKTIGEAFNDLLANISNALDGFNGSVFLSGMTGGLTGIGIFKWLYDLYWDIKLFKEPADLITDTIGTIASTLSNSLRSLENSVKADTIQKIAIAVAILAGAMFVLSTIKTDTLAINMAALYGLMTMLTNIFSIMSAIDIGGFKGMSKMGSLVLALNGLAVAILIIAGAMKVLSTIDIKDIGAPLLGLGAIFLILKTFIQEMEAYKGGMGKATAGIIGLSIGIAILSLAVKAIGALPIDQAVKGVIGVGILLGELAFFAKFAGEAKHLLSTGAAMIAFALAMTVLTGILFVMGKTSDTMAKGLLVMGVALVEFAAAIHFMEGSLKGAAALVVVAAAMLILAPALVLIGKTLNGDQIGILILALAGTLLVLTAAAYAVAPVAGVLVAVGAAIALLGIGLLASAGAIMLFSINFSQAVQTFLASAGALGRAKLAESLQIMFNAIIDSVKNAIIGLIKTILMIIPDLIEVVIALIDAFLKAIADHAPSLVDSIGTILAALLVGLTIYMPMLTDLGIILAVGFINGIADGLEKHQDEIFQALGHLLASLINFTLSAIQIFAKDLPVVGETVSKAIDELKNAVKEALDPSDLEDAAGIGAESVTHTWTDLEGKSHEMGGKTGQGFGEGLEDSKEYAITGAHAVTDAIQESFDETVPVWDENGNQINEHFKGGIDETSDLPVGSVDQMMSEIMASLGNSEGAEGAGRDILKGYLNGVSDPELRAQITASLENLGGKSTEGPIRKGAESHSPSKRTYRIGIDVGKGYILGLEKSKDGVKDAAGELADETIEGLEGAVDYMVGIFDYANESIGIFNNHWAMSQDFLSDTDGIKASTNALEMLALQLYETSIAAEDADDKAKRAGKTQVEILQDVKAAFIKTRDEFKKTLSNQTDMLEMFDFGKAVKSGDMVENFESNIRAITTFSQELENLADRGIDRGLLQHLASLGPKGLGKIKAFTQASEEEFEKLNNAWIKQGELLDDVSNRYMSTFAYVNAGGEEAFTHVLDPETGEDTGRTFMEATLEGMREAVGINLQEFEAVGEIAADAIGDGLEKGTSGSTNKTSKAAKEATNSVVDTVESNITEDEGQKIGYNLCSGIANGLRDGIEIATTAAEEMARMVIEAAKEAFDQNSPSRVFEDIGYYNDEGLAQGFTKYGSIVKEAAADTAFGAIDEMTGVFGRIADMIDGTIDLDPTIRPVLDLTNLQYGASQIGGLLGLNDPYALNATASLSGIQNDATLISGLTSSLKTAIDGMKSDSEIPPVTINIYATENQDAEEIANYTAWKLNHDVFKRRAVHGGV